MSNYVTPLQAYLEQNQANQRELASNVQTAGALQMLLANSAKQQREGKARELLQASGGDPEKASAIALQSGNWEVAQHLTPLVKLAQEQKMREQTPRLLAELNRPAPTATPTTIAPDVPTADPADASFTATPAKSSPMDARQTRLTQLTAMSMIPQYANNPVVQQRLQAEIDKLTNIKPMIEHNFAVGDNMVQPHISFDEGRSWQPVPGSKPSAKFAKQVAPVINMGAADKPAGDFTKTGDDFLKSIPEADRQIVKKIANYDLDPKTLSSKGGHREKVLSLVAQYDPTYDDTQYANKRRAITQFGSGPQGNTVRNLNVAIEHIDTLKRASDALKNGDFTPGNKAYNEIAKVFGVTPPNTFEGIRDIVANEVIKGTIGNAGALQDRAEAAAKVKASSSPQQLNELMNGWTELMGGQVKGLERQYEASTKNKDFRERYLTQRTRDAIAAAESKVSPPAGNGAWTPEKEQRYQELLKKRGS